MDLTLGVAPPKRIALNLSQGLFISVGSYSRVATVPARRGNSVYFACGGDCGRSTFVPPFICSFFLQLGADLRQEDPPNLNILLSGGKETNKDSPSNGE